MTERDFFSGDCNALARKGLLSETQRREWGHALASASSEGNREALLPQLRALFHAELDALTEQRRTAQNAQHEQTLQQSDLVAVAAGGLLGALNSWMRPAPAPAPAPAASTTTAVARATSGTSLWTGAFDAAQASLNIVRQRRLLDYMRIEHISGDESRADRVVLCINGFMTQGGDPSRNWGAWAPPDDARAALYAVKWEAGDASAWNDFCAHAHDNLSSAAATGSASSAAHGLLAHFTGNPWHKAQDKAEQVGILLAQVLTAKPTFVRDRQITLMGHSLGGVVVLSALRELARLRRQGSLPTDGAPLVHSAMLFAAAFIPEESVLRTAMQEISREGRLINVFSQQDDVLSKLFWAIQLQGGNSLAAGCAPLTFPSECTHGINVEVSDLVVPRLPNQFGHSYGPHMDQIRTRVLQHLKVD